MKSHFINNQWISSKGNKMHSTNPCNEEVIWEGNEATQEEVNLAIKSARQALESWSNRNIEERITYLERYREVLNDNKKKVSEAISQETGKILWDSMTEVNAMIGKIGISIDAYGERCLLKQKEIANGISITRHKPHGVLAVFGPYNFPAHLPNGHIIPALLAGNTILFKPSEYTPHVGEIMLKLWEQTELPQGVINLVQGGKQTGIDISTNPNIDGLLFTGSWQTGKILSETFGKQTEKILALEMGGNNPLIVDEISNLQGAAYQTIQSAYISSGQRCTCARRLIVLKGESGDQFIEVLKNMIKGIKVGSYDQDPQPFMGPVISKEIAQNLLKEQKELRNLGGKPIIEMELLKENSPFLSPGLIDVTDISNQPDKEIFGPLLQIIRVPNFENAIEVANQTQYGLAAGILTDNMEKYQIFLKRSRAGIVNWNTQLTGASSAAPFGGIGFSGNHRPSAWYAADYCAYPVASIENHEVKIPEKITPGITL